MIFFLPFCFSSLCSFFVVSKPLGTRSHLFSLSLSFACSLSLFLSLTGPDRRRGGRLRRRREDGVFGERRRQQPRCSGGDGRRGRGGALEPRRRTQGPSRVPEGIAGAGRQRGARRGGRRDGRRRFGRRGSLTMMIVILTERGREIIFFFFSPFDFFFSRCLSPFSRKLGGAARHACGLLVYLVFA